MEKQEIFDTAVRHLFKQGRPARNAFGSCRYRAETGLMCAVGCLIPDDQYDPDIEGLPADQIINRIPLFRGLSKEYVSLLGDLQYVHDRQFRDVFDIDEMKNDLRIVAMEYNLSDEVLSEG